LENGTIFIHNELMDALRAVHCASFVKARPERRNLLRGR
jgi:hypothetical protein